MVQAMGLDLLLLGVSPFCVSFCCPLSSLCLVSLCLCVNTDPDTFASTRCAPVFACCLTPRVWLRCAIQSQSCSSHGSGALIQPLHAGRQSPSKTKQNRRANTSCWKLPRGVVALLWRPPWSGRHRRVDSLDGSETARVFLGLFHFGRSRERVAPGACTRRFCRGSARAPVRGL